jgi:rhodanese-related sulfurtransferase
MSPAAARQAMTDGWILVDVRSGDQRARGGVIPGSLHAALSVLEWRVDPASGSQQPDLAGHEGRLILICAEGYSSSLAAVRLHELGFSRATDVIGGFAAWKAEGLPVEAARD